MNNFNINALNNPKTLILILWILLVITILFIYFGYNESNKSYENLYDVTYGKITQKKFEKYNITKFESNNGLNLYYNNILYKLKNTYEYKVNKKKYIGYFYNDDNYDYDKKITLVELKKLDKKYTKNYPLKIYYLKTNHGLSCVSLDLEQIKNSRFYYGISSITFILSILLLSTYQFFA